MFCRLLFLLALLPLARAVPTTRHEEPKYYAIPSGTTTEIPWSFREDESSGPTDQCPAGHMCPIDKLCCPDMDTCCSSKYPNCLADGRCVNDEGAGMCKNTKGEDVEGTICESQNCCPDEPFNRCAQGTPTCVDLNGFVGCGKAGEEPKPGVLCNIATRFCCPNPKRCCTDKDGNDTCCMNGIGGPLPIAPLLSAKPGTTPGEEPEMSMEPHGDGEHGEGEHGEELHASGEPHGEEHGEEHDMHASAEPHADGEHGDGDHSDGAHSDGEHGDGEHGDGEHGDGEHGGGEEEESEEPEEEEIACFPASANVELRDGTRVRMDQVRTGDEVRVGENEFSRVFMWTHSNAMHVGSNYVRVETDRGGLTASTGHVVYVCRGMKQNCERESVLIEEVRVGDGMWGMDGLREVVNVKKIWERGLYNPHTEHGDLVVDDMLVSCYTRVMEFATQHALLTPIRGVWGLIVGFGGKLEVPWVH